uniref:PiggyBac transposable element-derived protein 3 n=1 Tax=Larimichthys crocea TaxID=215358 RepID=A0A0F8BL80_LARCR
MKASVFYGKRVSVQPHVRPPPEDSEDSCLSDSAGSDEEYVPKPGDGESSSESDRSSSDEEVSSTSAQAPRKKQKRRNKEKMTWKTRKQTQSSEKNVPAWQGALPDSDSIRLPIDYIRQFFDTELLALIVNQSNLYSTQENPNHALKLDQEELEQFIGSVLYMSVIRLPRSRIYWSNACRVCM